MKLNVVLKVDRLLSFSPKSVSHPVFEGQVAKLIHDEYVSGTEVHVALLEDICHYLLCCGSGVFVALEFLQGVALDNLSDELSGLTRICLYAETVLVSDGFSGNLC